MNVLLPQPDGPMNAVITFSVDVELTLADREPPCRRRRRGRDVEDDVALGRRRGLPTARGDPIMPFGGRARRLDDVPSRRSAGCTGYERLVTRWLQPLAPRRRWKAGRGWKPPRAPPPRRPPCADADSPTGSATPGFTSSRRRPRSSRSSSTGIVWKIFEGAWPAIQDSGLSFIWESGWVPNDTSVVRRLAAVIVGTIVTSFGAVLLAAPLSIAIGLFLSELAADIRGPIGTLIEMLAAVPSVVVGLWGIFVLGPFMLNHVEPFLSQYFGWIPLFSGTRQQRRLLPAIFVLTIMIIPITSSICRELFVSVPRDVKEAPRPRRDPLGDGARRRRAVRKGGARRAVTLGLGRALGEAIAVTQVIGNRPRRAHLVFAPATRSRASSPAATRARRPTSSRVAAGTSR